MRKKTLVVTLLLLSAVGARADETAAPEAPEALAEGLVVESLAAWPEKVELSGRFDYRQLLLQGQLASGEAADLTRLAVLEGEPAHVRVDEHGAVFPVSDGDETLVFRFGDHRAEVPVSVRGTGEPREVSFVRDIEPILSRMGCNAGTCHGSKDGKNGFKLSLRGYDPLYDHRALTDDLSARRFNRAAPDQSLMLLKATGSIPHVGGGLTQPGERYYQLLRDWIAAGSQLDIDSPRVESIRIEPENPVAARAGMRQQMAVLATFADGSQRDVTKEAFVESGNIEVAVSEPGGLVRVLRRGEAAVLVRYEGRYAATTITVMGDRSGFEWPEPPVHNYVDELTYAKLKRVKIAPSELCTDDEFLRRVHLDLTGLPPSPEAIRSFLADPRPQHEKRDALVDALVGSEEYVEHWTNKWADLLQVNRKFLGEEGAVALRDWIKQSVATNKPYDQFAFELLTASGSTIENPPAAYYKILRDPDAAMENTTHLFLAIRFNCNKCHDHPFERWTQDQYYHLAAYFAQVGLKEDPAFAGKKIGGSAVEGAKPLVEVVFDRGQGEVNHERTGEVAPPAFPYDHQGTASDAASRREQLAHWIVSPHNPYFAKSFVNRLWGYLLGVGIIEPIDDIRAGNPPTNPELLERLTSDFVEHGFDVQHVLRTICKSRVYQHSVVSNRWNEDDRINFSHALPRRLPAEVLFDAIHAAAGSQPKIPGIPAGFRAAEIPDAGVKVPFLDDFGRPPRESACECERSTGVVLGPVMKLVNGPTVAQALADPNNALTKLVAEQPDDDKVIEEVYLRFLGRAPDEAQLELGRMALRTAGEDHQEIVDELREYESRMFAKQEAWERRLGAVHAWTVLKPVEVSSSVGAKMEVQDDGSVLVSEKNGKGDYTVVLETDLSGVTALRLEAMADDRLPAGGPGRAENGNFVLSELKLQTAPKDMPDKLQDASLAGASADFGQQGYAAAAAIDGNQGTGWAVAPQFKKTHTLILETTHNLGASGSQRLVLTLQHNHDDTHTLGRFRVSATTGPRPVTFKQPLEDNLARLLSVPPSRRNPRQKAELAELYRQTDTTWKDLRERVEASRKQLANRRLAGVQDLAWALINNPAFLFNR